MKSLTVFSSPWSDVLQILFVLGGSLSTFRLVGRRCVVYASGSVSIHGYWHSHTAVCSELYRVYTAPYQALPQSFAGARIYVGLRDPRGVQRAVCVASAWRTATARSKAQKLADVLSTYSAETIEYVDVRSAPAESRCTLSLPQLWTRRK